jgi:hypothetical protein
MEVTTDDLYKIGTKNGIIAQLFIRNQFSSCDGVNINDISTDNISLGAANSKESMFEGQGFFKCFCTRKYYNNKCICKKNVICNSCCHNSLDCKNK